MGKLTRFTQLLFGSTASAGRISEYGSLQNGTPTTYAGSAATPALIQGDPGNFESGWDGAVIGNSSPAIQDANAVQYLNSYQLAYLLQEGIAEYDAATTYYINSICQVSGVLYVSLVNTNIGNAPASSPSDWTVYAYPRKDPTQTFLGVTGTAVGYVFTLASATATVGATYTNNSNTFTVLNTIAPGGAPLFCSGTNPPTASGTLTKASGTGDSTITFSASAPIATYTTPAGCTRLMVNMVGGGGGGADATSAATAGTLTAFGADILVAFGGGGGSVVAGGYGGGSGGGVLTLSSGLVLATSFSGSGGGSATSVNSAIPGGSGGVSAVGGAGMGGAANGNGANAASQSGSGGGGVGGTSGSTPGAGGGAGGYISATLIVPAATYVYCIGVGGTHPSSAAGNGATGFINIIEYYN